MLYTSLLITKIISDVHIFNIAPCLLCIKNDCGILTHEKISLDSLRMLFVAYVIMTGADPGFSNVGGGGKRLCAPTAVHITNAKSLTAGA